MKANVAWSTEENARLAGKACAKKAVLDLIQTKVAFIFSSTKYNQNELVKGVKEELGTAPIIGCTSNGGIATQDGYITSKHGFAGILALGDNETAIGTAGMEKQMPARETGRLVAKRAMEKVGTTDFPTYFYMIASDEQEEYAKGIRDIIGNVACFGGTPAAEENEKDWTIFTEDSMFHDGVAVAFFYTNKTLKNVFESKYHETVNSGVVTKISTDRTVIEIDGIQALKRYCEWIGKKNKDLTGNKILENSILTPLAVKTIDGEMSVIRQPVYGEKDYGIKLSNNISVNTAIVEMQISKEELLDSPKLVTRELNAQVRKNQKEIAAYLIFQNAYRKNVIIDNIDEMIARIKTETNDVPFIMPFSYGEYGKGENTGNLFGSLMISATGICK